MVFLSFAPVNHTTFFDESSTYCAVWTAPPGRIATLLSGESLHQRGKNLCHAADKPTQPVPICFACVNAYAFCKRVIEIPLDAFNTITAVHPNTVFKVMYEAPVIHIDGAYHSRFIISEVDLCVDKSRLVFVDFYTRFHQPLIMAAGQFLRDTADFCGVALVGCSIGLVMLLQEGLVIPVTGIKRVRVLFLTSF